MLATQEKTKWWNSILKENYWSIGIHFYDIQSVFLFCYFKCVFFPFSAGFVESLKFHTICTIRIDKLKIMLLWGKKANPNNFSKSTVFRVDIFLGTTFCSEFSFSSSFVSSLSFSFSFSVKLLFTTISLPRKRVSIPNDKLIIRKYQFAPVLIPNVHADFFWAIQQFHITVTYRVVYFVLNV